MSNILITGASGFLGSNLARRLLKSKNKISIFIRKQSNLWRLQDIISDLDRHVVDISDVNAIKQAIKKIKPDIVYHCATYGVYPSQKNLNSMIQTNVIGSNNLMQVLEEYNELEKFINIGSSFEYGTKSKSRSMRETDMVRPVTPYGIVKVTQTHLAQYFALRNRLPVVTLRVFTPYGRYEEPGRLISDIMISLIKGKTLKLSSPKAKRDFIYIDDVINALLRVAKTPKIEGEIFNIGTGKGYHVEEVANLAQKATGVELKISWNDKKQYEFDKLGKSGFANIEKAKRMLQWSPTHSIKQGLSQTYDWYKENIRLYVSS